LHSCFKILGSEAFRRTEDGRQRAEDRVLRPGQAFLIVVIGGQRYKVKGERSKVKNASSKLVPFRVIEFGKEREPFRPALISFPNSITRDVIEHFLEYERNGSFNFDKF